MARRRMVELWSVFHPESAGACAFPFSRDGHPARAVLKLPGCHCGSLPAESVYK